MAVIDVEASSLAVSTVEANTDQDKMGVAESTDGDSPTEDEKRSKLQEVTSGEAIAQYHTVERSKLQEITSNKALAQEKLRISLQDSLKKGGDAPLHELDADSPTEDEVLAQYYTVERSKLQEVTSGEAIAEYHTVERSKLQEITSNKALAQGKLSISKQDALKKGGDAPLHELDADSPTEDEVLAKYYNVERSKLQEVTSGEAIAQYHTVKRSKLQEITSNKALGEEKLRISKQNALKKGGDAPLHELDADSPKEDEAVAQYYTVERSKLQEITSGKAIAQNHTVERSKLQEITSDKALAQEKLRITRQDALKKGEDEIHAPLDELGKQNDGTEPEKIKEHNYQGQKACATEEQKAFGCGRLDIPDSSLKQNATESHYQVFLPEAGKAISTDFTSSSASHLLKGLSTSVLNTQTKTVVHISQQNPIMSAVKCPKDSECLKNGGEMDVQRSAACSCLVTEHPDSGQGGFLPDKVEHSNSNDDDPLLNRLPEELQLRIYFMAIPIIAHAVKLQLVSKKVKEHLGTAVLDKVYSTFEPWYFLYHRGFNLTKAWAYQASAQKWVCIRSLHLRKIPEQVECVCSNHQFMCIVRTIKDQKLEILIRNVLRGEGEVKLPGPPTSAEGFSMLLSAMSSEAVVLIRHQGRGKVQINSLCKGWKCLTSNQVKYTMGFSVVILQDTCYFTMSPESSNLEVPHEVLSFSVSTLRRLNRRIKFPMECCSLYLMKSNDQLFAMATCISPAKKPAISLWTLEGPKENWVQISYAPPAVLRGFQAYNIMSCQAIFGVFFIQLKSTQMIIYSAKDNKWAKTTICPGIGWEPTTAYSGFAFLPALTNVPSVWMHLSTLNRN
ncbi:hypothetical protein GOP47_0012879 [Adiantum capillus-veneris]|uniref:F-box domain-containing protein n=1 Tax=Adiantum capillus-veneris TaxID=13818 RepID=A0A9D4ZEQ9_ADICA|nr:hypothetical protein GOP47_0012879 [Adiantum capillus-veneris]